MHDTFASIHQSIDNALADLPSSSSRTLVVGYSGGVDSSLLLDALIRYQKNASNSDITIHAVYVNHGLSDNADAWQIHCAEVCRQYSIPFSAIAVSVNTGNRKSLESEARDARYEALLGYCKAHQGVLVLGQHGEDQLETFLLQLKRGAGPKGLSCMAPVQCKSGVFTVRPMLNISKAQIIECATQVNLSWVEDESNQNNDFDRNFLRNSVLPLLTERWPQLSKTVSRSASLCAQQNALVSEEASKKLALVSKQENILCGESLLLMSPAWQAEVVRAWFDAHNQQLPSSKQLSEILHFLSLRADASPQIDFAWGHIYRHGYDLYWVVNQKVEVPKRLPLVPNTSVSLPWLNVTVSVNSALSIDAILLVTDVSGEVVKPVGQSFSKPINRWFKTWNVPVWLRRTTPVFYIDDIAIGTLVEGKAVMFTSCPDGVELGVITNQDKERQ